MSNDNTARATGDEEEARNGSVEFAVRTLGDILNTAFSDALRVDHLARLITQHFGDLGFEDRVALGELHPRLTEKLVVLEHAIDQMDDRR